MVTERITFQSGRDTIVGCLYLPDRTEHRWPTVIVTGSWTTVKEQMPAVYAGRLAEAGFAALTFDSRHWGESGGDPRAYESPTSKIEDIQSAARYLQRHAAVDPDRIAGLAVCASAGYMAHAIAAGAPIRALVLVAAWLHDPVSVVPLYGGEAEVRRRIDAGRAARQRFEESGTIDYVRAYDPNDPYAAMFFPLDYYASPAAAERGPKRESGYRGHSGRAAPGRRLSRLERRSSRPSRSHPHRLHIPVWRIACHPNGGGSGRCMARASARIRRDPARRGTRTRPCRVRKGDGALCRNCGSPDRHRLLDCRRALYARVRA